MPSPLSERKATAIAGAVFFVNILDFMMVMPLGPFFSQSLHFPEAQLGWVGGSYTFAAALAGLGASFFLDRFDRRKALAVTLLGLVIGTVAGAFATSFYSMLAARILAGCFGGPAASVAVSILTDVVAPQHRGRAMGRAMTAFSVSSVLGVPAGLYLAQWGTWQTPFYAVAALGLLVGAISVALLPPLNAHVARAKQRSHADHFLLLKDPLVGLALLCTGLVMFTGFSLIPNLPAFLIHNLGVPADHLGLLYAVGGSVSVATLLITGPLVDKAGVLKVATVGTLIFLGTLAAVFGTDTALIPAWAIFVFFMMGMGIRNITNQAQNSKVPLPEQRAGFQSLNNAAQHLASAIGAVASTQFLSSSPDGHLLGLRQVALLSGLVALGYPFLAVSLEKRLKARGER
jgi:predicted MFS family arabinose efflux permease